MKFNTELALFLKARYPVIYINTIEEDRVEYVVRKNVKTNLNRSIYTWDFIDGYTNNPNNLSNPISYAADATTQAFLNVMVQINNHTYRGGSVGVVAA